MPKWRSGNRFDNVSTLYQELAQICKYVPKSFQNYKWIVRLILFVEFIIHPWKYYQTLTTCRCHLRSRSFVLRCSEIDSFYWNGSVLLGHLEKKIFFIIYHWNLVKNCIVDEFFIYLVCHLLQGIMDNMQILKVVPIQGIRRRPNWIRCVWRWIQRPDFG